MFAEALKTLNPPLAASFLPVFLSLSLSLSRSSLSRSHHRCVLTTLLVRVSLSLHFLSPSHFFSLDLLILSPILQLSVWSNVYFLIEGLFHFIPAHPLTHTYILFDDGSSSELPPRSEGCKFGSLCGDTPSFSVGVCVCVCVNSHASIRSKISRYSAP